jgi:hypothetical protein
MEGRTMILSGAVTTHSQESVDGIEEFRWDEIHGFEWGERLDWADLQYMTTQQSQAFSQFRTLEPSCRLHGSTVYGLSSADSDIHVCVWDHLDVTIELVTDVSNFAVREDLRHLRKPRLIIQHSNGTDIDVAKMTLYEPEKDNAFLRI